MDEKIFFFFPLKLILKYSIFISPLLFYFILIEFVNFRHFFLEAERGGGDGRTARCMNQAPRGSYQNPLSLVNLFLFIIIFG